jgi:polyhydroxyalkanoate synthesis regulator phasin
MTLGTPEFIGIILGCFASLKTGELGLQWLKNGSVTGDRNIKLIDDLMRRVLDLESKQEKDQITITNLQAIIGQREKEAWIQSGKLAQLEVQLTQIQEAKNKEIIKLNLECRTLISANQTLEAALTDMVRKMDTST